mmetsp:Transcript_6127/g.9408  ORF Transcript_6127/g.9408 Transcript_6127/m.9408 type:complete len:220 (+) Transcript_6127:72-731(+)|eukprot:CAMPEP_0178922306 /NCGR_PEP_ID=MMETSP0786-20121207/16077_1 /TAXON_ID=186022 /ORGANISM="Thalassionema frauenfeldii, Strain CCMP 1798" /LENGTH=219 /DNA_ID=CAMNT_0020596649 /DNA_START=39 /DNA_END=698 /DNA_ORIENTATION=-
MAEADSPSWLTGPGEDPPVTQSTANDFSNQEPKVSTVEIDATADANPSTTNATTTTEDEDKDLPGIILIMRLANMGVSIALMTCSIFMMVGLPSLSNWVLAVYATCGGLLICCLETQLKFLRVLIAVNFGFLFNSVWRFLFYLLLASVTWAYGNLFGNIIAIALTVVAVMNTYILCRYPAYRKMREKIAEEEDKRIESRISQEVRKQAVSQAATSFGNK